MTAEEIANQELNVRLAALQRSYGNTLQYLSDQLAATAADRDTLLLRAARLEDELMPYRAAEAEKAKAEAEKAEAAEVKPVEQAGLVEKPLGEVKAEPSKKQ